MRSIRILTTTILLLGSLVTSCGVPTALPLAQSLLPINATALKLGKLPAASDFTIIECQVNKVLKPDTSGLWHQNFVVRLTSGKMLTVNHNNGKGFGETIKPLVVGDTMTIKGITYGGNQPKGIHWTHHSEDPAIGGFVKLSNGAIFQ